jgi:hypothetical protein
MQLLSAIFHLHQHEASATLVTQAGTCSCYLHCEFSICNAYVFISLHCYDSHEGLREYSAKSMFLQISFNLVIVRQHIHAVNKKMGRYKCVVVKD